MIIAMAADHGGYELKNEIKKHLEEKGFEIIDLGTNSSDSVNYPDYGKKCGEVVASKKADLGMVFCGTGIGISIAANKVKGIRCALVTSEEMAKLTKEHNNANILAMGGRTTSFEKAKAMTDAWLDATFEGGRHQTRIELIEK